MLGISVFFWSPHIFTRDSGIGGFLFWLFAIDCRVNRAIHYYGMKLRLFGVEVTIWYDHQSAQKEKPEFDDEDVQDWARYLMENGVKIAIPKGKTVDLDKKTFVLPSKIEQFVIGIGDRIALGAPSAYEIVRVEGFREQGDGTTLYFYTPNLG